MANKDSTLRTFTVIGLLCFVCSILVCGTVVVLKPLQEKEMNADREKSVLEAAGIDYSGSNVSEVFAQKIEAKLLDLKTSAYVDSKTMREIVQCDKKKSDSDCAGSYNFVSESKLPEKNVVIPKKASASKDENLKSGEEDSADKVRASKDENLKPGEEDIADIKVRARYMPVYLVKDNDQVSEVVLPFYGQGLWSTMYGYLAVDADGSTIKGVKYYSQGETAGLGAEVTNPAYTGKWIAKKLYENGEYKFKVTKGADKTSPYQVDAISGATLTSDGVNNSVKYWFEKVYADYLRGLNHK